MVITSDFESEDRGFNSRQELFQRPLDPFFASQILSCPSSISPSQEVFQNEDFSSGMLCNHNLIAHTNGFHIIPHSLPRPPSWGVDLSRRIPCAPHFHTIFSHRLVSLVTKQAREHICVPNLSRMRNRNRNRNMDSPPSFLQHAVASQIVHLCL